MTTRKPPAAAAMSRMDGALHQQLMALGRQRPGQKLPFLVTLMPGARAQGLVPFVPTLEVEITRLVAGEMTAAEALALAARSEVERVEFDGEAQAIGKLLGR